MCSQLLLLNFPPKRNGNWQQLRRLKMGVFCNTVNDMTSYPFSIFQFFRKMFNWLYLWKDWSFYGTSGNTLQNSKFKTCRLTKAIKLMEARPGSLWVIVQYVLRVNPWIHLFILQLPSIRRPCCPQHRQKLALSIV